MLKAQNRGSKYGNSLKWFSSLPDEAYAVFVSEFSFGLSDLRKTGFVMYLGELVRRVLLKMAKETALFGDTMPAKLATPYLLRSPDMAAMHQDASEDHEVVDEKWEKNIWSKISNSTPMVREVIAEVCDIVAERRAHLAGAGKWAS
ncbi:hexokinase-like 3 [Actinidia rufa]|uniref:Phosphotransferase n=1 Tax=Actinidia rufa TaxID=165716 RepID=A0A7J0EJY2_9ERIC|nr:hexokinase-like 3 [Actinidia rufa]